MPDHQTVGEMTLDELEAFIQEIVRRETAERHAPQTENKDRRSLDGLKIFYDPGFAWLFIGSGVSLRALSFDSDGAYQDVTSTASWSLSNPAVAQVSNGGTVIAIGVGAVEIVARYREFTASTSLTTAPQPVLLNGPLRMEIRPSFNTPIEPGSTFEARAYLVGGFEVGREVTGTATFISSDERVATVQGGHVVAVATGTTDLRATAEGFAGTFRFSVFPRRR